MLISNSVLSKSSYDIGNDDFYYLSLNLKSLKGLSKKVDKNGRAKYIPNSNHRNFKSEKSKRRALLKHQFKVKRINSLISKVKYFDLDNEDQIELFHQSKRFIRLSVFELSKRSRFKSTTVLTKKNEIISFCKTSQLDFCESQAFKDLLIEKRDDLKMNSKQGTGR